MHCQTYWKCKRYNHTIHFKSLTSASGMLYCPLVWEAKPPQGIMHSKKLLYVTCFEDGCSVCFFKLSLATTLSYTSPHAFYSTILQPFFHVFITPPSKQWYYQEHCVLGPLSINKPFGCQVSRQAQIHCWARTAALADLLCLHEKLMLKVNILILFLTFLSVSLI